MEIQNLPNDSIAQGQAITGSVMSSVLAARTLPMQDLFVLSECGQMERDVARWIRPLVRIPTIPEIAERWPELETLYARSDLIVGSYNPICLFRDVIMQKICIGFIEDEEEVLAVFVTGIMAGKDGLIFDCPFVFGRDPDRWEGNVRFVIKREAQEYGCSIITGFGGEMNNG